MMFNYINVQIHWNLVVYMEDGKREGVLWH